MAWSGVRQLESAPMRARVGLCLSLPIGSPVNTDPLALALMSGRERLASWVGEPSMGPLPSRRLAAAILERACREAVRQFAHGDPYPLEWIQGPEASPIFARLLADREPLVWRHAAIARGLLAAASAQAREEIDLSLDPTLSATEWRRAVVSLVACLSHDPDTALPQLRKVFGGPLVKEHSGLLSMALWGLPPVIDADPDVAEELVALVAKSGRPDVAEELAHLRRDVRDPNFAAGPAVALAAALPTPAAGHEPTLSALTEQVRARLRAPSERSSLIALLHGAMEAFESEGAFVAHGLAIQGLADAHRMMTEIETAETDGRERAVDVFTALADLGAGVLESSRLHDLLLLGRRPGDPSAAVPELEKLHARLGNWLLRTEQAEANDAADLSPAGTLMRRRKLVVFLHLLDTETSEHQAEGPGRALRQRLRAGMLTLLDELAQGPDASVHRVMCAALARSFDAAVREDMVEPGDLLMLVMARIDAHRSLRALIEGSTDADMRACLGAFDEFLTNVREEDRDAIEPTLTRPQRLALTFTRFSSALPARGSYRGEALRQSLLRMGRSLDAVATARALAELVAHDNGSRDWTDELERAMDSASALIYGASARVRGARLQTRRTSVSPGGPALLSGLLTRQIAAKASLGVDELNAVVSELGKGLPKALLEPIAEVMSRLERLPHELAAELSARPLKKRRTALPDWLLPRRTIGGFYVVSALGSGGVSTVFIAKRIEERKDERAETYALKIPHYDPTTARSLSEQEFIEMFREEAGALLSLPSHPNLSEFVNFDMSAKPKPILVMELIRGQALEKLLFKRSLTVERVFHYLDGILSGMGAMHAVGVAHLDIKPSNIILRDDDTPALVDFGLSGRQLRPGCGTLEYCAPEVLGVIPEGYVPEAPRADLYAFACTAYELLTGELLFDAENESGLMSQHVSHDGWPDALASLAETDEHRPIAAILGACLRRDPRNRPTVHEVRAALQKLRHRVDVSSWLWPIAPRAAGELIA
jgi:hypothetical protein